MAHNVKLPLKAIHILIVLGVVPCIHNINHNISHRSCNCLHTGGSAFSLYFESVLVLAKGRKIECLIDLLLSGRLWVGAGGAWVFVAAVGAV